MAGNSFEKQYPNIAFWIKEQGQIEMGYEYNTGSCVRAIDEGGMPWSGGEIHQSIDEWMQALETGIGELIQELGL